MGDSFFDKNDPFDRIMILFFKIMAVWVVIGMILEVCIWIGVLNSVPELLHAISSRLLR